MAFTDRLHNRGSISTGYDIENSLKLEADNTEYLSRTAGATGSATTWTASMWVKRTEIGIEAVPIGAVNSGVTTDFWRFRNTDQIRFHVYDITNAQVYYADSTAVFRDTAAWYHVILRLDSTNSDASKRLMCFVNGEALTDVTWYGGGSASSTFGASATSLFLGQYPMYIGRATYSNSAYHSGYIAEVNVLDGIAAEPTDFGEYDEDSGIWKPKAYTGSYGTNGFYLDFKDAANLGNDASGNGNNFTENNITSVDQATDTPTNNFCTLNPISYDVPYIATQGNTKWSKNDTTYGMASGTHYVGAGKWYWEIKATDINTYNSCRFGIIDAAKPTVGANEYGYEDPSLSANDPEILAMSGSPNNWYMNSNSTIANNGSTNSVDYSFYDGDILAFALDMDNGGYWMGSSVFQGRANGSFWIAPNGTSGSVAITDPTNGNYAIVGDGGGTNLGTPNFNGGTINGGSLLTAGFTLVTPLLGAYSANTSAILEVNFGGFTSYGETGGYSDENGYGNFAYAVPSGFYCLCSKNIAEFGGTA